MVPGQASNNYNLGNNFEFLYNICMLTVLIRIASMTDSNDYTHNTILR